MISLSFILPRKSLTLVESQMTLNYALNLLETGNFLSLPVVKDNKFWGVISKERILRRMMETPDAEILVEEVTRKDMPCLSLANDSEEAALLLANTNIPFIAINDDNGVFLGIITHKTIFKHYASILGINKGHKLVITSYDIKGRLAQLTDIIAKKNGNILSLIIDNPNVSTNVIKIVVRLECENLEEITTAIESAGFSIRK
ncbi:CBS domain-containing protein [Alkaliphilus peptidifermentans]|uniref:Acetoin utilization protein AcuB n=1 Tax=Alkaliphilus peptidifermentans DSM 18978 TaxID=1120976 RepID=A0A1G5HSZ6_9FIRM|nr:CBS domain-containing protein [Alkaliphilus peptidifermentans]SCY66854.1 acetoin utilization protein AcuB [Alkaliphilus peptidifermentans DSM 18978]